MEDDHLSYAGVLGAADQEAPRRSHPDPRSGTPSAARAASIRFGAGNLAYLVAIGIAVPWALRPAVCAIAVAMLTLLLAWFAAEVITGAGHAGLAERTLGVAQAVWPLVVVLSCRHPVRAASAQPPAASEPAAT